MPPYDPQSQHRRSIRLKGYDYSLAGAFFVTICVQGGMSLLCDATTEGLVPNAAGQMVQASWVEIPQHYSGADIDAFVVMPNHVHGIILLTRKGAHRGAPLPPASLLRPDPGASPRSPSGTALTLAAVVQRWKSLTTARYGDGVHDSGWPPYEGRLWQRNYYEHIIRHERELDAIRAYIESNPAHWYDDPENLTRR